VGDSGGVEARGLCRRFGRRWALARVDLDVPRGHSLMITGANGSGKTTLLRCLATALAPHEGTIRIHGADPWADPATVRKHVSLLSHATRLYEDLGARDNLAVWAALGGLSVDVDAALRAVGLDPTRTEAVRAYSAGMRRRVALALAMLKNPDVVLFDEPFAALDPAGRDMMAGVVRDLRTRGATIVIATHLPAVTGPLCDAAIHLDNGQVVWRGLPIDAPTNLEPEPSEASP
jgi:heme exporter protein A